MSHPLFEYADRIAEYRRRTRSLKALEAALTDEHLARDIGLPVRPPKKIGVLPW